MLQEDPAKQMSLNRSTIFLVPGLYFKHFYFIGIVSCRKIKKGSFIIRMDLKRAFFHVTEMINFNTRCQ